MNEIAQAPAAAIVRPVQTRRWRVATAVAAVAVMAAGITTVEAIGGHSVGLGPTAFAVTKQPHGMVEIRVVSTAASAQQMTRQLHDKGLNINVETVPVTPALVGTWVSTGADGPVPDRLVQNIAQQALGHVVTVEVPSHFPGQLSLTVGRPASTGETPVVGDWNALAPGGPLACQAIAGSSPAAAEATLNSLGYTVDGYTEAGTPLSSSPTSDPPSGVVVTEAFIADTNGRNLTDIVPDREHDVVLQVTSPSASDYNLRVRSGFAATQKQNAC